MRIAFTAYTDDSIVQGELALQGDRLSDFIPLEGPFRVEGVTVQALEDGRSVTAESTTMARDDLIAITGSGPRGSSARRVRTRPHPVRIKAGPYEVVGYVHALPSAHPFTGVLRRRVLPITSAVIRYVIAGRPIDEAADVLLVNPTTIDWLKAASDAEMGVSRLVEIPFKVDRRAKDMTGDIPI